MEIKTIAKLGAIMTLLASCSEKDVVSVSPSLSDIKVTPATLYTGQKATVSVTYSDFGEHVYFSSGASYTCIISGNNYNSKDSIPVFKEEDLRIPIDFSFQTILPPSAGTYTLTFRTPTINKSAGGKEGESIFFQALSKQTTITVTAADAINANFGDSRETVAGYINVSDTIFGNTDFDAAGKASAISVSEGFAQQQLYKFKNNALTEVDDEYAYAPTGSIKDDNGNVTAINFSEKDITNIQRKVQSLFFLENTWSLIEGNIYDPETAKDEYKNIADNDTPKTWGKFLNDLTDGKIKSYTYIYEHQQRGTRLEVTLYAVGSNIVIVNKYTKTN